MQMRDSRKLRVAILLTALTVRLAVISRSGWTTIRFGDAPDYMHAAASLCTDASYPTTSSLPFFRAPGLPFFIAGATACHPEATAVIKVGLALVDVASVALIMALAREAFAARSATVTAGALAAMYPFFLTQVSDIQSEALFMCLYLAAVFLALKARGSGRAKLLFAAGTAGSAAALVRPAGLLLLGLIPLFTLVTLRGNRWRSLLAFAAGVLLCLGPWVVRNALQFHELILVNDAGAYNFWRGASPQMQAVERISDPAEFAAASLQFETVTSPAAARQVNEKAQTPAERSREWYKLAFLNIAADPMQFFRSLLRNAWAYWRPWLTVNTHSVPVVVGSGVAVALLYILGLAGWRHFAARDAAAAWWCASLMLLFWVAQIPFQVTSRFRIPIEDPLLIVFAAGACAEWLHQKPVAPASRAPFAAQNASNPIACQD